MTCVSSVTNHPIAVNKALNSLHNHLCLYVYKTLVAFYIDNLCGSIIPNCIAIRLNTLTRNINTMQ